MIDNIIKYGKNREMVIWSSADVFCSLSKEELEKEREVAEESAQKFHELMLLEKASSMNLDDFIYEYKRWEEKEKDHEKWLLELRWRKFYNDDWRAYQYNRDTYDTTKATDAKIKRFKKLSIIKDHVLIIIALIIGSYSYLTNFIYSLFWFGIAIWGITDISIKWYHMYTERDIPKYVNG